MNRIAPFVPSGAPAPDRSATLAPDHSATLGPDRYARMFAGLHNRGEGALGAFLMLGDPDFETSAKLLEALAAGGADMIEVGIPFSDPIADGPVIQAAAGRALKSGITPRDSFALLNHFRVTHRDLPVGILTYANMVVACRREHFYRSCACAGVDSLLLADVPILEAKPFIEAARAHGIDPILIAAPNTPDPTLREIARKGRGYTYCVSRFGVTGTGSALNFEHGAMLRTLGQAGAPPPIFGFGISEAAHVEAALDEGAAGVIVGSALVRLVETHGRDAAKPIREKVAALKAATLRPPKRGSTGSAEPASV